MYFLEWAFKGQPTASLRPVLSSLYFSNNYLGRKLCLYYLSWLTDMKTRGQLREECALWQSVEFHWILELLWHL